MNIVLLKYCKGTARLILHRNNRITLELNNIQLTEIQQNFNINTGVTFKGSPSNYKREAFITDFDGYPYNGTDRLGFYLTIGPIVLNSNIQSMLLAVSVPALPNNIYFNSFRFTYILVDIYSF